MNKPLPGWLGTPLIWLGGLFLACIVFPLIGAWVLFWTACGQLRSVRPATLGRIGLFLLLCAFAPLREASADTVNATTETKLTQCWHSETTPPPFTLSPPAPTRVVDETRPSSGIMAQYRHEIEMDAPVGVTTLTTRIEPK